MSFLSDAERLAALLPPGFALSGEPLVSVTALYQKNIGWLAGRGYNILGVRIPATFSGQNDHVTGTFLAVLWENLADPIVTGREELGFAKVYAELPEPEVEGDSIRLTASWLGFAFLDMRVSCPQQQSAEEIARLGDAQADAGDLHYKYIPRTGAWGEADVSCATFSPASSGNLRILERRTGTGELQFHKARWEDMPTQFNIVNALAELPIREYRGASIAHTVGGKDLRDTRELS